MSLLQFVCYQLWERLGRGDQITFVETPAGVEGAVFGVFQQYYEEALQQALTDSKGRNVSEYGLRTWFGTKLITEARSRGIIFYGEEETAGLPTHSENSEKHQTLTDLVSMPQYVFCRLWKSSLY